MALSRTPAPQNMVSEREHIREILTSYVLWQLGLKLTATDKSMCRLLADKLGLKVDQIAAAMSEQPDNPGFGVVLVWSRRKNSTIGVLRKTLAEELKRPDLVEMLDKARQSKLTSAYRVLE